MLLGESPGHSRASKRDGEQACRRDRCRSEGEDRAARTTSRHLRAQRDNAMIPLANLIDVVTEPWRRGN